MQSINFSNSYFKTKFGYPLPPKILDVKSIEDVVFHITIAILNSIYQLQGNKKILIGSIDIIHMSLLKGG